MKFPSLLCSSLLVITAGTAFSVNAEIVEIPAEEMTEAYIRSTTVVIPKEQKATANTSTHLGVKKLDSMPPTTLDIPETKAGSRPDLTPVSDNYLSEQWNQSVSAQNQPHYHQPTLDPFQAMRDDALRSVLGLDAGTPIDYSQLQFPTTTQVTPPAGISYDLQPNSFSISVPNSGNYASSVHQAQDYTVNVTPTDITFTINLPQR